MNLIEGVATTTHLQVTIELPGVVTHVANRRQMWRVAEDVEDRVYKMLTWEVEKAQASGTTIPWFGVVDFTVTVRKDVTRGRFLILVTEDKGV